MKEAEYGDGNYYANEVPADYIRHGASDGNSNHATDNNNMIWAIVKDIYTHDD